MKIAYLKTIILIGLTQFSAMSSSLAQNMPQDEQNLLPRTFCQNKKGTVSETGISHIFICCYLQKKKCTVNNEQEGHSQVIQFLHINNKEQVKEVSLFN